MECVGETIDRMKEHIGANTDADLAKALGVRSNAVAQWRHRNSVPVEHVIAFSKKHETTLDWLLRGEGPRWGFGGQVISKENPVSIRLDKELHCLSLQYTIEVHQDLIDRRDYVRFSECLAQKYEELMRLSEEWSKLGADREEIIGGLKRCLLELNGENHLDTP